MRTNNVYDDTSPRRNVPENDVGISKIRGFTKEPIIERNIYDPDSVVEKPLATRRSQGRLKINNKYIYIYIYIILLST